MIMKPMMYLVVGAVFVVAIFYSYIQRFCSKNAANVIVVGGVTLLLFVGIPLMMAPNQYTDLSDIKEAEVLNVTSAGGVDIRISRKNLWIRSIGADTPRRGGVGSESEKQFLEARNFAIELLQGKKIWISMDTDFEDKGAINGYIWLEKPDNESDEEIRSKMYNARLILSGNAKASFSEGSRYNQLFKNYEEEAKSKKIGIWR